MSNSLFLLALCSSTKSDIKTFILLSIFLMELPRCSTSYEPLGTIFTSRLPLSISLTLPSSLLIGFDILFEIKAFTTASKNKNKSATNSTKSRNFIPSALSAALPVTPTSFQPVYPIVLILTVSFFPPIFSTLMPSFRPAAYLLFSVKRPAYISFCLGCQIISPLSFIR